MLFIQKKKNKSGVQKPLQKRGETEKPYEQENKTDINPRQRRQRGLFCEASNRKRCCFKENNCGVKK